MFTGLSKLFKYVGGFRDGLLILISITYILGYIVWTLTGIINNFGPLPAIEAQYFVAGLLPLLTLIIIFLIVLLFRRIILKEWPILFKRYLTIRIIIRLLYLLIVITVILYLISKSVADVLENYKSLILVISFILVNLSQEFFNFDEIDKIEKNNSLTKLKKAIKKQNYYFDRGWFVTNKLIIIYVFPIIIGFYGFYYFVDKVYSKIPQEWGGLKPKEAYFDISTKGFSQETLKNIVENNDLSIKFIRTKKLKVYFRGNDYFLIGIQSSDGHFEKIEIDNKSIFSVKWCN